MIRTNVIRKVIILLTFSTYTPFDSYTTKAQERGGGGQPAALIMLDRGGAGRGGVASGQGMTLITLIVSC